MNVGLEYYYACDSDKEWGRAVFRNPDGLDPAQVEALLRAVCDSQELFVVQQVGLEDKFFEVDEDGDHGFHYIHSLKATTDAPTDTRTLSEFVAQFLAAAGERAEGWDPGLEHVELRSKEWQDVLRRLDRGEVKGVDGRPLKPTGTETGRQPPRSDPARPKASQAPKRSKPAGSPRKPKAKRPKPPNVTE